MKRGLTPLSDSFNRRPKKIELLSREILPKIIFPLLFLGLLFVSACANQDEHLIFACQQELDQAYLRAGKPAGTNFETLTTIQIEANDEIFKLVYGQNGLSISTNVLKDHILVIISRDGEVSSRTEWRPPNM